MNERTVLFKCKRRDGLTIRGNIYGMESGKKKPAVIVCHGFLTDSTSVRIYAKLLAKIGYVAFTFDFCGGGLKTRSDGRTEDMTVFTELTDLLSIMEYALSCPFTANGKLSLMGCSQGGFVAAMAAKGFPDMVERLVMFYPALCISDDARRGRMLFYMFDPDNIPDLLGKLPVKLGGNYARSVIDIDAYEQIRGYEGPVLLVHGTHDLIVNISYSDRASRCYPYCKYERIWGAGHGFAGEHDKRAMELLRDFMRI